MSWEKRRRAVVAEKDLLGSGSSDRHFVVEVETMGPASIRFGDETYGDFPTEGLVLTHLPDWKRPRPETSARIPGTHRERQRNYRWGSNPLPAVGERSPRALKSVRQKAPFASAARKGQSPGGLRRSGQASSRRERRRSLIPLTGAGTPCLDRRPRGGLPVTTVQKRNEVPYGDGTA